MSEEMKALLATVERWQGQREPLAKRFAMDGLDEFVRVHNGLTRELISVTGKVHPEFWSAWIELGQNASRMVQDGKLFVGQRDRTHD